MGDAAGETPEDQHFKRLQWTVCPRVRIHRTPLPIDRQLAPQAQHPVGAATADLLQCAQKSGHSLWHTNPVNIRRLGGLIWTGGL
jgi:hypothetical protein